MNGNYHVQSAKGTAKIIGEQKDHKPNFSKLENEWHSINTRLIEREDMTIDEVIENLKCDIEIDMYIHEIAPQIAEWLKELKMWRTSIVNNDIKNPFANTSTLICHNCDHKDEYIVELEYELGK